MTPPVELLVKLPLLIRDFTVGRSLCVSSWLLVISTTEFAPAKPIEPAFSETGVSGIDDEPIFTSPAVPILIAATVRLAVVLRVLPAKLTTPLALMVALDDRPALVAPLALRIAPEATFTLLLAIAPETVMAPA